MKNILLTVLSVLFIVLLLSSCEKEIKFNGRYDGEKLVLYSCVNPDTEVSATVYHSSFFLSRNEFSSNEPVTDAKVIAEIDGKEYPMTYSQEEEKYECKGRPSVGSKVIVKASREGYKPVQGEVVVPKRPNVSFTIGAIEPEYLENGKVKLYKVHLMISIEGAEQDINYLRLNAYRKTMLSFLEDYDSESSTSMEADETWQSESLMTKDIAFFATDAESVFDNFGDKDTYALIPDYFDDGKIIKGRAIDAWMTVYPMVDSIYGDDGSAINDSDEKKMEFDISDFKITLESLSQDLFRFLKSKDAYFSNEEGLGSIFSEPVAISNNIQNGIGCVGAVASTTASYQR
jgi:hypothetical protein